MFTKTNKTQLYFVYTFEDYISFEESRFAQDEDLAPKNYGSCARSLMQNFNDFFQRNGHSSSKVLPEAASFLTKCGGRVINF